MTLTVERLRQALDYNAETGKLVWKINSGHVKSGSLAGYVRKDGYRQVSIDGIIYLAHRLIWFGMTGKWPENEIDHVNMTRGDNRWTNLREATSSQNNSNKNKQSNNTSGLKGVRWHKAAGAWTAQIWSNNKNHYLGLFATAEAAHVAYCKAAERLHREFSRTK